MGLTLHLAARPASSISPPALGLLSAAAAAIGGEASTEAALFVLCPNARSRYLAESLVLASKDADAVP